MTLAFPPLIRKAPTLSFACACSTAKTRDHNYLSLFLRFIDQMRRKRLLNVCELGPEGGDFFSGYFVLGEEFIQRSLNKPAPLLSVDQLRADFTTRP